MFVEADLERLLLSVDVVHCVEGRFASGKSDITHSYHLLQNMLEKAYFLVLLKTYVK